MNSPSRPLRSIGRVLHRAFALGSALAFVVAPGHAQSPNEPNNTAAEIFFPDEAFRPLKPDYMSVPPKIVEPMRIYFPPEPPPLGQAIAPAPTRAPAKLALFVNETFYPALGTRLTANTINDKLRDRLERYRSAKVGLQEELRAGLDRLVALDPAARAPELIALNRRQTPEIVELEAAAEELRRDLTRRYEAWGVLRNWSLSDGDKRGYTPAEVAEVMRAAAFYQDDLSLDQRGLLREIAIELGPLAGSTASEARTHLFFSPAPARILPPDDLPADVASKLASYQTKKSALKKELYDAVYANDGKSSNFLHHPLRALAQKQAAPLAELETLAEEIRLGLAGSATPNRQENRLLLSPALESRVSTLVAGYFAAQKEAAGKVDAVRAAAKDLPMRISYRFDGDRLRYWFGSLRNRSTVWSTEWSGSAEAELAQRIEILRVRIAAVADEYHRRLPALYEERKAIRAEIIATLGASKAEQIDRALPPAPSNKAEDPYLGYRRAVLQPGLSPEQRRLLFDGALEQLQLPLPFGDYQPTIRKPAR